MRWLKAPSPLGPRRVPEGFPNRSRTKIDNFGNPSGLNGQSYHSACTRHVFRMSSACICGRVAEGLPKGCGSNAEGFPKHPEAMRKTQTTPDWTPMASRRLADDAEGLRKGCRSLDDNLRSTLKPFRIKPFKTVKSSNVEGISIPSRSRRLPEGMRKGSRST